MVLAILAFLPIFHNHYKSVGNEANIVYNSVIIVNVLWLMNHYKMQYSEILACVVVFLSAGASCHRIFKTAKTVFEAERPYKWAIYGANIIKILSFANYGQKTDRISFVFEPIANILVIVFELIMIKVRERESKRK